MRWLRLLLRRLVCSNWGHDWAEPVAVQFAIPDEVLYHTHCYRCLMAVLGTFDDMNDLNAWVWRNGL